MQNHAIVKSRIKPQVHRINKVIRAPNSVKIVVKPSASKMIEVQTAVAYKPSQAKSQRQKINSAAVVQPKSKLRRSIHKKTNVVHATRDVSPESILKIQNIRNSGRNRILVIVGNGPSLNEAPLQNISGSNIDILSINKPDDRIWPTSHWAFFDRSQIHRHEKIWNNYNGMLFNSTSIKEQRSNSMQFKHLNGTGFSRDLAKGLHIGRSSVYASMQIALWMNYDHIYIFGCDMNPDGIDGKLHFYGTNPDVEPQQRKQRFEKEAESYNYAAEYLQEAERKRFTFCTEYNHWSFIQKFNCISHKTAVENINTYAKSIII